MCFLTSYISFYFIIIIIIIIIFSRTFRTLEYIKVQVKNSYLKIKIEIKIKN